MALNQRPAVVAVAPVLGDLRADTGLSSAMAGLLTTLPVLCFGAFAPLAPRLARRIGLETAVALSLVLLAAGIALRLLSPVALLFAGQPAGRRGDRPRERAAAGLREAGVPPPGRGHGPLLGLAEHRRGRRGGADRSRWPSALGVDWRCGARHSGWCSPSLALALWLPVAGTGHAHRTSEPMPEGQGSWSLLRQPLARQVTAYLGLQSVQFYSVAAWLPTLLADAGVPVSEGGLLLGLANVVGAAGALLAPAQAGRMRTQRPLILAVALAYVVGLGGLLLSPADGTLVWVAAFGLAQGSGFALALTLIVLRSPTPLVAARLGGVAQCLGYLLAALGPLVLGALHDLTDGWTWPLALLLAGAGADDLVRLGRGARRRPRRRSGQRSVTGRCSNPRSVCRSRRTGRPLTRRPGNRSARLRSPTTPSSRARPGADAVVDAGGEGQVVAGVAAADVEPRRVGEDLRDRGWPRRAAASRGCPARTSRPASDGVVLRRPAGDLHGAVVAQHLLDRAVPARRGRRAARPTGRGAASSSTTPLPSRFTVVSNPAPSSSITVACSSRSVSASSSGSPTSRLTRSSPGSRRSRSKCSRRKACMARSARSAARSGGRAGPGPGWRPRRRPSAGSPRGARWARRAGRR